MSIQQMTTRLGELQRVRANLNRYVHPDDLGETIALALKYVGGTVQVQSVISELTSGLDDMINSQKENIKQALCD